MHVCVYMCLWVGIPMQTPTEAGKGYWDSWAIIRHIILWRQGLSLNLQLADLARLAGLSVPGSIYLQPNALGLWAHVTINDICTWMLGI